jgi:hypothetical protein
MSHALHAVSDDEDNDNRPIDSNILPMSMADWRNRAPSFTFAGNKGTMLVWDTEEGSGIITKYSTGKLPLKHTDAVISILMKKIESLTKLNADSSPKKRQRMT